MLHSLCDESGIGRRALGVQRFHLSPIDPSGLYILLRPVPARRTRDPYAGLDGRVLPERSKEGRESPDGCLPAGLYNCVAARSSLVLFFFFPHV
jgi:hypothetical protein